MAAIGILGGTFDPVHNAHLAMARAAAKHLGLDKVVFIPTGTTHYREPAQASGEDRVAMLKLAINGNRKFQVDERELRPDATGYTVDTLRALRTESPEATLHLLIGADQQEKLSTWHRLSEIRNLATIHAFTRPGVKLDSKVKRIPMDPSSISASEIRNRVRRGEDLSDFVPPAVANYIATHGLYS